MDPRKVFTPEALSVERVMIEPGRGFYIPSYQRPYAWTAPQVKALLTNIFEGIASLVRMDDAITFIGSFIFIHDTKYETVEPKIRNDLPQGVFLVIDGQQRLGTLSLIAVVLHNAIRRLRPKVHADPSDHDWISRTAIDLSNRLELMFSFDKGQGLGEGSLRWYPRIIRAHEDSWSLAAATAQYASPIPSFLATYIRLLHSEDAAIAKFSWNASTTSGSHDLLAKNWQLISRQIQKAVSLGSDDEETLLPDLHSAAGGTEGMRRFFQFDVPDGIRKSWASGNSDKNAVRLQELSRLFLFSRYFLDRVAVTQVLVTKEDYAFDLFEALNTTGDPLTAYETFKPIVIRQEGLAEYKLSPSAKSLRVVEAFLERFIERRTQASDRILIPFALSEKGVKLGRHLRDQRNWLRTAYYEKADSQQAQRTFLHGMAIVADFLMACWPEGGAPPLTSSLLELDGRPQLPWGEHKDDADLCLRVLRDAGHEITVALLARFYGEAIDAADIDRAARTREFLEALRAVTAFFALWRGSRVGTENIDAAYRSLMSASFGRHKGQTISSATLKEELRQKLKEKNIVDRDSWVSKAAALPVYVQSVELTKLLLLAASHDAIPDGATPGLETTATKRGFATVASAGMRGIRFGLSGAEPS